MTLRAFLVLAGLLAAAPAMAAETLGLDYAWPGMTLGQLRYADWPPGAKLICGGDPALPDGLASAERQRLALPRAMVKAKLTRCGLFTEDAAGGWIPGMVRLAGNPAEFWAMVIADDGGERVVQVYLVQRKQFFGSTLDFLTQRFGPPKDHTATAARWATPAAEATLGPAQGGGVYVLMNDTKLQDLMQTRIAANARRH